MSNYRPRGTLARALFEKIHNDQYLESYDTTQVRIYSYLSQNLI